MEMLHIVVICLGVLLLIAAAAWVVKVMLKPAVIITVFAVMGWLMWYSGLGYNNDGPNANVVQEQLDRLSNDE